MSAIIALRKRVGSQAKLAELLGTTDRTVKRWERGAVPNGRFKKALIAQGIPEELFERAKEREQIEERLRIVESEIAQIRRILE